MHAAVYQQRPDMNVVIHTHQPYASALALMNKPIPALFDEQVRYLGRGVEIVHYAPSGTTFLKSRVKAKLKNGDNAYILANHGVLVLGGDTESAVHNMALLEKVALDYLLTLLAGEKAATIPLPIREIAFGKLRADEKKLAGQEAEAAREVEVARTAAVRRRPARPAPPTRRGPRRPLPPRRRRRARLHRAVGRSRRSALRDQRVSRRGGRLRRPGAAREGAAAQGQTGGHEGVPRLLRDEVPRAPRR